jgi:polyisoprenoid-binding protein YceI
MAKRLLILVAVLVIAGVLVAVAGNLYIYISGGSGEASEEITAPTLVPRTAAPGDATEAASAEAATEAAPAGAPGAAESSATEEAAPGSAEVASAETTDVLFRIVPEESEVRFNIEEDFRGERITVVGTTSEVAGDILVDQANPSNSQIGTIRINVRTLRTDQEMRNRAIRSEILESAKDEFEFSEFVPTSISGMPESVEVGTPFTFTIVGDLTVKDVTKEVTFETTVTPVSEDRLEGLATTTIMYADYVSLPPLPGFVANVGDEVVLELEFVATRVENASS